MWQRGIGPDSLRASEVNAWRLTLSAPFDARQRDLCRRFLRALLGSYLGVAPEAVFLETGRCGKPGLDRRIHVQDIQFNMSHSGRIALFALAMGRRVGIDIQQREPLTRLEVFSRGFLSPREHESLMSLPVCERDIAFLACWTRDEAAIKALGGSIAQRARTAIAPAGPSESWELRDLPIGAGYAAALCYENPPAEVRLWTAVHGSARGGGSAAARCRE